MKVRRAAGKDTSKLSRFIKQIIFETSYYSDEAKAAEARKHNTKSLKEYLDDRKYYYCLIAEEDKNIIGFIIGRNEAGVFWTDWLGVDKRNRRNGIAERLMRSLETNIKKIGVHKIWCDTRTNNKKSTSLLKKLKYKKLGIFQNGWYNQDFFLWEKNLGK